MTVLPFIFRTNNLYLGKIPFTSSASLHPRPIRPNYIGTPSAAHTCTHIAVVAESAPTMPTRSPGKFDSGLSLYPQRTVKIITDVVNHTCLGIPDPTCVKLIWRETAAVGARIYRRYLALEAAITHAVPVIYKFSVWASEERDRLSNKSITGQSSSNYRRG